MEILLQSRTILYIENGWLHMTLVAHASQFFEPRMEGSFEYLLKYILINMKTFE